MESPRLLGENDAEAYVELRREMLVDSPWSFMASPADDRGSDASNMRELLARGDSVVLGAFDGAQLVAVAGLMREGKIKRQHLASIWGVYVAPAARRRGLGRAVITAALAVARSWPGVVGVQLTVSEHPAAAPARALYASLGFVAWGTEPDALNLDGQLLAETHLHLSLR